MSNSDTVKIKQDLRKFYKTKRGELYEKGLIEEISSEICRKISDLEVFKCAQNILLFYPKGSEINTLSLTEEPYSAAGGKIKNFYLPVCKEKELVCCPYNKDSELVLNEYKIYEPTSKPVLDVSVLDIVVTPALSADIGFYRLGWGGGYYDRFFANKGLRAVKMVVLPHALLSKSLPHGTFDIQCDIIVTEKTVLSKL